MNEFVRFLLGKTFLGSMLELPEKLVADAFEMALADARWHYPQTTAESLSVQLRKNADPLAVYLFRLASLAYQKGRQDLADCFAWLLKECCCCEIYYSNQIGTGFLVVHGVGTVIGSRNTIGKGFQIFQGCTIGHRVDYEVGCTIGDNVILFANSSVVGSLTIGDHAVIGAHCLVMQDVPANAKVYGALSRPDCQSTAG